MDNGERFSMAFWAILGIAVLIWCDAPIYITTSLAGFVLLVIVYGERFVKTIVRITCSRNGEEKEGKFFTTLVTIAWIALAVFAVGAVAKKFEKPPMTTEERMQIALERQLDFGVNVWFQPADTLPATNSWWTGTVREQRPFVNGIYQTKVVRDSDNTIFLTLAGRKLSPDEKVEVGMFEYRSWQGSFVSLTHVVR